MWCFSDKVSNICWLYATFNACNAIIPHWLFSFCLRNNTKPKQESFEFKAPQGPPPQPPTQVSPQVRKDGPVMHSPVASFIHYVHFVPPSNTTAVHSPSHQLSTHIHVCLFIRPSSCSGTQTSLLPLSLHVSTIPPAHLPKGKQSTFLFIFFPLYVHLLALSEPMH